MKTTHKVVELDPVLRRLVRDASPALGLEPPVDPDKHIFNEYSVDGLDWLEFAAAAEARLGVSINFEQMEATVTIRGLADMFKSQMPDQFALSSS